MAERIDNIGFGDLQLIQEPSEFCYGVDAVLLADFAARAARHGGSQVGGRNGKADFAVVATEVGKAAGAHATGIGTIVDLGTGTGIVPLILSYKTDAERIIGVEVQKGSYERAVRSAAQNGLEGRVSFVNCDVKDISKAVESVDVRRIASLKGTVDIVTSNPPYMKGSCGLTNSSDAKMIARHETTASLDDFLSCGAYLLKNHGSLFMVHRPSRLVDLFAGARKLGLEPKKLQMVSPKEGKPANIVLVQMVKGGGSELTILPELHVYTEEGEYTEELRARYR